MSLNVTLEFFTDNKHTPTPFDFWNASKSNSILEMSLVLSIIMSAIYALMNDPLNLNLHFPLTEVFITNEFKLYSYI